MERITVTPGERSYSIIITTGLSNEPAPFLLLKSGDQVMLVTNETPASLYLDKVRGILEQVGTNADSVIFPDGEQYKNLTVLDTAFTALPQKPHGRDTTLVALGGGVIGDLTGSAAASYQHGARFIRVPTILLSQADFSVGGKTAVNHPLGKNMIGTFHQPVSMVVDLDCLKMLPVHELASGLAEVIKYGIILDGEFSSWLEDDLDTLLCLDGPAMAYCIRRCCKLRAEAVTADGREMGSRVLLNLGHTSGHATEAEMGYGNRLHGEAVTVGIVMATRTSECLGQFTFADTQRTIALLQRAGLPVNGSHEMSTEAYLPHMPRDKKVLAGEIRLVLP